MIWKRFATASLLNAKNIVFVEPVGADSKVAQLISESKK